MNTHCTCKHEVDEKGQRMDRVPLPVVNRLRIIMGQVFGKQAKKFAGATKPSDIKFVDADHKEVVEAVRPILMGIFKSGGDKALKSVRRFSKRKKSYEIEDFAMSEPVETKSLSQKATEIPEWIDDPSVIEALEDEMFAFAQQIDGSTAGALREELIEGMANGETIPQLKARIQDLSEEWVEGYRAEMIARTESTRAYTTGHVEAWKSTGVVDKKIWVSAADACPFCLEMNGTVVELDANFLDEGDSQTVNWRGGEIEMSQDYSDVGGPPLHPNCRCVIIGELKEEEQ